MKAYSQTKKNYKITNSSTRFSNKIDINSIEKERNAPNFLAVKGDKTQYTNYTAGNTLLCAALAAGISEISILDWNEDKETYLLPTEENPTIILQYGAGKSPRTSHPYSGLFDSRGELSRYPIEGYYTTALSRGWVEKYTQAGGEFDAYGVYGLYPFASDKHEEHWAESCNPEHVERHLDLFGRLDGHLWYKKFKDSFCDMLSIYKTHNPKTMGEYHRASMGIERKEQLLNWTLTDEERQKIERKSVLSFGWMSDEKFDEWAINNISSEKCTSNDCLMYKGTIIADEYRDRYCYVGDNDRAIKLISQFRASRKRKIFSKVYTESEKRTRTKFGHDLVAKLDPENWYIGLNYTHTSAGDIYKGSENDFYKYGVGKIKTKKRGDITFFCLDKDTCYLKDKTPSLVWFAFKDNFDTHVESETLRGAIKQLESRNAKGGLKFSLNDVRNDRPGTASFCLTGTKSFLADRMPFLYNLIKEYRSWEEIPEAIMCEVYSLADRSIFKGYPQP